MPTVKKAPEPSRETDPIEQFELCLTAGERRIALHRLFVGQVESILGSLTGERYPAGPPGVQQTDLNEEFMAARLASYRKDIATAARMASLGGFFGTPVNDYLWISAVARLSAIQGRDGFESLLLLRRYPALVLLYTTGICAVAAGRYGLAAKLLLTPVEDSGKYDIAALRLTPMVALPTGEFWCRLFNSRYAPWSLHLFKNVRELLRDIMPGDNEYRRHFDEFEYLAGVSYVDAKLDGATDKELSWVPMGLLASVSEWNDALKGPPGIQRFVSGQSGSSGDKWDFLQHGLFRGSSDRFRAMQAIYGEHMSRLLRNRY